MIAGTIASGLEVIVRPIGFNRDIALALIPAMAAREVAVSSLATVYSIEDQNEASRDTTLVERLRGRWPLPTALAFLAWFVFAPQCLSTVAVTRRETNGWKWPAFMLAYLFVLAYLAAGATFWLSTAIDSGVFVLPVGSKPRASSTGNSTVTARLGASLVMVSSTAK